MTEQDLLEKQKDNQEAIELIMGSYNVNEKIATDLWHRFIDTVGKMKKVTQSAQTSGR